MTNKLLFFIVLFSIKFAFSQSIPLSDKCKISILTCGNGNQLYSTFGHTAIRISDYERDLDVVYNYGMFDFNEGNFYLKFVKGDLQYFVATTSYQEFLMQYQFEQREVLEQTLNLSAEKKQQLFELLNSTLQSEDKFYTYKFIDRNCTTMVLDKINLIFGFEVLQKIDSKIPTYREVLNPYFKDFFYYKFGISIIFGEKVDRKAEKLFLPIELFNSLAKCTINGQKLVSSTDTIVKTNQQKPAFNFLDSIYFVSTLLLLLVILNFKKITSLYFAIMGFFGIFFCLVGFYSLHEELLWNYNALLFNPLLLFIAFLNSSKFKSVLVAICLISFGVYAVIVISKPHFLLVLPFIIATSTLLIRSEISIRKLLTAIKNNRT
jgi:Domain of unknown function (DUF4105)